MLIWLFFSKEMKILCYYRGRIMMSTLRWPVCLNTVQRGPLRQGGDIHLHTYRSTQIPALHLAFSLVAVTLVMRSGRGPPTCELPQYSPLFKMIFSQADLGQTLPLNRLWRCLTHELIIGHVQLPYGMYNIEARLAYSH